MNLKKTFAIALAIVLTLGLLAGCGQKADPTKAPDGTEAPTTGAPEDTNAPTATDVPEETDAPDVEVVRTKLVVGFDAEFPPYGYKNEAGEYVGFDLDLAAEVCARLGWELVKQPISWDAKDMELESGAIDCIWNGFTINGREGQYEWTAPYVDNSQVFIVKADSGIATVADLAGKTVAVQTDSSAQAAIEDEDNAELLASLGGLEKIPDYNNAFMNLEAGAVDAVAMDIGVADYQIAQRAEGMFVQLDEALATEQYGVGFKLGNTELRDQVMATLNEMAADGKFAEIAETWGLTDAVCLGK